MYSLLLAVIYLAFIGLGLPDSLLGSAWPSMYEDLDVPVSYAGIISMIIALNTVIASLNSDRLTKRLGAGAVTLLSFVISSAALFGFSVCRSFPLLCLLAIPYGLGAGSVDAALNNYIALHYESRHMSWLHCMWGVGTIVGPYMVGASLSGGLGWGAGYRSIGYLQLILTAILLISLPLWKKRKTVTSDTESQAVGSPITLRKILSVRGAKEVMLVMFFYSTVEATTMLWASSYMVLHSGISVEKAADYASLFFIGITVGRAISGFLTIKFSDSLMIRAGQSTVLVGIAIMLLPIGSLLNLVGLIIIGFGCAPIYPCIIHSTPTHFGTDLSQAVVGVQMASAYIGTTLMPPLFGFIAGHISVALLPLYLLCGLIGMFIMHELLERKCKKARAEA